MKIFSQIVIALALLLWMAVGSLEVAGRYFIQDAIELHGSSFAGSDIQFKNYTINWKARTVLLNELCIPSESHHDFFCMGSVLIEFKNNLMPDFNRDSLIPDVLEIDAVEVRNVVVFYAVDSDVAKDEFLQFGGAFSAMANDVMKKRLSSELDKTMSFLNFKIAEIRVSNIKVDANSKKNPEFSKIFSVRDVLMNSIGYSEGGVAAVEVLDRMMQAVIKQVRHDAYTPIEAMHRKNKEVSHNKPSGKESSQDNGDSETEGLKGIGEGIKNTGQKIWKSTKNLFN